MRSQVSEATTLPTAPQPLPFMLNFVFFLKKHLKAKIRQLWLILTVWPDGYIIIQSLAIYNMTIYPVA